MIRLLAALLLLALPAAAQQAPLLRMQFDETETIPGQPLSLRLTVLVPSFMPAPPIWPSMEAPNLLVRVASSGPASARVDGATWSGVTRHYLIAPMIPGDFALSAQQVPVTWADPETSAPRQATLSTEPLVFAGVVPEGAEGLDPFIAAEALELAQSLEGDPEAMAPGASVIRTVTATIRGTSPMFLPGLLPPHDIQGLHAYPDQPVVEEREDRGVVTGSRTERVSLIAEGGGSGTAPAIELAWFNLATGAVETATVEAIALSVEGPPAARAAAAAERDWRMVTLVTVVGALALALATLALRWLVPRLRRWLAARRDVWLGSEACAWRRLTRAIRGRDQAALRPALDGWASRVAGPDPRRDPRLQDALTALGAARFGPAGGDASQGWRDLARALPEIRRAARGRQRPGRLPPLNPGNP